MATFLSDIANTPARAPRFGGLIARLATFVVPTGMVLADDADLLTFPKGSVLFDMLATTDTIGQTSDIGDAVDDDRFIAAAADNALTRISLPAGANFVFAADTVIKLKFNTGNPTAAGIVKVRVSYLLTP